jgi:urea transport system permease protein
VAIGGRGTLYGAVIGAFLVNYAKTYFTAAFPDLWLFLLGGLFVISTLYLPKGIVGLSRRFLQALPVPGKRSPGKRRAKEASQ